MTYVYYANSHGYEDSLMHTRTKGSPNGIRRYQNKDGTRTPLGKIHAHEWYEAHKQLTGRLAKSNDTKRSFKSNITKKGVDLNTTVTKKYHDPAEVKVEKKDSGLFTKTEVLKDTKNEKKESSEKEPTKLMKTREEISNASDKELAEAKRRIDLENQYYEALTKNQGYQASGKKTVQEKLEALASRTAAKAEKDIYNMVAEPVTQMGKAYIKAAIGTAMDSALGKVMDPKQLNKFNNRVKEAAKSGGNQNNGNQNNGNQNNQNKPKNDNPNKPKDDDKNRKKNDQGGGK